MTCPHSLYHSLRNTFHYFLFVAPSPAAVAKALRFVTANDVSPYHEQINGFRPEGAVTLLRRAAREYPDGPYADAVAKLPPLDPAHLDHLTGPRLVANDADSR